MKTLIAATALVLTTFSASAEIDTSGIQRYVPNADLSALTEVEKSMLISVIYSDDTNQDKRRKIKAALE